MHNAAGNLYAVELRQQRTGTAESPAYTVFGMRMGLAPDAAGNVAISNPFTHAIYRLTPAGEYVLVAGKAGEAGSSD